MFDPLSSYNGFDYSFTGGYPGTPGYMPPGLESAFVSVTAGGPVSGSIGDFKFSTPVNVTAGTGGAGGAQLDPREACTEIVNQAEPLLQQNLAAYQSGAAGATDALQRYDEIWAQVVEALSQWGQQGAISIQDRERAGRWPWAVYYRDPIASPGSAEDVQARLIGGLTGASGTPWLLIGVAAVVVLLVVMRRRRS